MDQHSRRFVGLDVAKLKISVAVADGERGGEVRFFWGHTLRSGVGGECRAKAGQARS